MNKDEIKKLLEEVKEGEISVQEAMEKLKVFPYLDLDFAKLDSHRSLRRGFPEAIFCEGKSLEQVKEIAKEMRENTDKFMFLRAGKEIYEAIKEAAPEASYHSLARMVVVQKSEEELRKSPLILVVTAGTADVPIAEEAAVTAQVMGNQVERLYDVGIAGVHRLLDHLPKLREAHVLIVVAGMEGALPSLVGGLIERPVVAVPTSIGYGASFGGFSALLAMLNSCAPGIGVVNIDNGFGAGYLASLINQLPQKFEG